MDLKSGTTNVTEVLAFEQQYKRQVADRNQLILSPHPDKTGRIPIAKIYVASTFVRPTAGENEVDRVETLPDLLPQIYRMILLGTPGGGKSTFSQKVVLDLASDPKTELGGRNLTPFLVVIRDYGTKKQQNNWSIIECLSNHVNSDLQLPVPKGAIEYLLLNGRAAVFFDGLDELLDSSYRRKITEDIESFCNLFPNAPVVVTSRAVGYAEAPLDPKRFELCHLSAFNEEQVSAYIKN